MDGMEAFHARCTEIGFAEYRSLLIQGDDRLPGTTSSTGARRGAPFSAWAATWVRCSSATSRVAGS